LIVRGVREIICSENAKPGTPEDTEQSLRAPGGQPAHTAIPSVLPSLIRPEDPQSQFNSNQIQTCNAPACRHGLEGLCADFISLTLAYFSADTGIEP
jgi:hypothetical protein